MSEPKDTESTEKGTPAAAGRPTSPVVLPPVTVEGTLRYNPYAFAPPAPPPPAPPVAAAAAAAAPPPLLGSALLGSVQSAVEAVATRAGSSVSSIDLVHELGLTESVVRAHFPADAPELAVFVGMLSDATDREYRARVGVTQRGLCVTAADTAGARPHPHAFVHIPYCYLITYVRCRATQRPLPDAARPAPHLDPAPYPAPADGLRLYTTDGRVHVLYRVPVDSLIAVFDYWWRVAVRLVVVQPAPSVVYVPYVPQQTPPPPPPPAPLPSQQSQPKGDGQGECGKSAAAPAAAPVGTTAGAAAAAAAAPTPAGVPMAYPVCTRPPPLGMGEAQAPHVNMYVVQQGGPSLFGVTQTHGTVLAPSPYKRFVPPAAAPAAGTGAATTHASSTHSHAPRHTPTPHSCPKGYQPLTQDGDDEDEDDDGIELRPCSETRP